jgi:putative nucleotidyltransferase with HDIG domain
LGERWWIRRTSVELLNGPMKIERTFLHSKVARRIFFMFVWCALLPISILAAVSFFQVAAKLHSQNRMELRQASKARGMTIVERLETLDAEIRTIALGLQRSDGATPHDELEAHFVNITVFYPQGKTAPLLGSVFAEPSFKATENAHLMSGKSLLLTRSCGSTEKSCLLMIHAVDPQHADLGLIAGQISPDYLWDKETLPSSLDLSVFDASTPLLGGKESAPPLKTITDDQHGQGERWFEWRQDGTLYDASYWRLLLAPQFHAASWTIVMSRKHDEIAAPITEFRQTFLLVVLLALWTITLASLMQIRRTLGPVEKLREATQELVAQRFDSRVQIESGDEFQDLGTSFNSMADQLGKQFQALKTIHEIDQSILASFDHDGIIDAVLERLPHVLPCQRCAIALTKHNPFSTGASLIAISGQGEPQRKIFAPDFSEGDMLSLRDNPQYLHLPACDPLPTFLTPLNLAGEYGIGIFPISHENLVVAALVFVQAAPQTMSDLDIQNARQIADQLAIALSNVKLMAALKELHWGTLTALARAIDAKSSWTAGHSERVTRMALKLGRAMGLNARDLEIMHRGGLLHDIGKIGTPQEILDKPGKLTPLETKIMREHVEVGLRILEPIPGLSESLPIVAQHHEWFDGAGYPKGLAGTEINFYARIFGVADSYDAMTSDRPYRKGLPVEKAISMIRERAGTQFDPAVVEVFLAMCSRKQMDEARETSLSPVLSSISRR